MSSIDNLITPKHMAEHHQPWEKRMNSLAWSGIIVWGIVLTGFGLLSAGPAPEAHGHLQPHDVVFLVAGGLLSCLIGCIGLMGLMGWVPGLRKQKSCV